MKVKSVNNEISIFDLSKMFKIMNMHFNILNIIQGHSYNLLV